MSAPIIKCDLEQRLSATDGVVVELGCGPGGRKGRINIDSVDLPNVDVVTDLNAGLGFLPDESVDELYTSHLLEHLDRLEFVLAEIMRVLKRDGRAYVRVPHFSNPYFYSDYTHSKFFGLYTFFYFVETRDQLTRKVPNYYSSTRICVERVRLVFRSPLNEGSVRTRLLNRIFNSSSYMQELYEAHFCYLFPCYELYVVLTPPTEAARDSLA